MCWQRHDRDKGAEGRCRQWVGGERAVVHGENFSNANTMHNAGREEKKTASTKNFNLSVIRVCSSLN
jgi:hypothetical protein